ncbi:MAG: hypothetical protein JO171_14190 [Paludibacterium sp.]|uniref:hypothetical protein n=1 Tax=Paludibacterium sp. TaxID=1917523 RepID=UPI0025FD47B0|nr:hypothetical protein [Paludibacterium sp.]MBV8048304.1 hypothetical protein [Paludibacterium sp.]
MPGGKCAANLDDEQFVAAARCGSMSMRIGGLPLQLGIGGLAEASFPQKTDSQIQTLAIGEQFSVVWNNAVFYGQHPLVGKVIARLVRERQATAPASIVRGDGSTGAVSFFPAVNRNFLFFEIEVPRIGARYTSDDPIVNSAKIGQVPPYGAVYKLEQPVTFRSSGKGLFNRLPITIETCSIKLVELSNVKLTLSKVAESESALIFSAEACNQTTEADIQVAWMLWPNEGEGQEIWGLRTLGRRPQNFRFAVPKAILHDQKWLAVAITKPFHTEAAQVTRLPLLV